MIDPLSRRAARCAALALLAAAPARAQEDEIPWFRGDFDSALVRARQGGQRVLVYFWIDGSRHCSRLYGDVRFTDLKANLLHFRVVYENILFASPEGWEKEKPGNERHTARAAYYRYIEAQLADVNAKLDRLAEMPRRWMPESASR